MDHADFPFHDHPLLAAASGGRVVVAFPSRAAADATYERAVAMIERDVASVTFTQLHAKRAGMQGAPEPCRTPDQGAR